MLLKKKILKNIKMIYSTEGGAARHTLIGNDVISPLNEAPFVALR